MNPRTQITALIAGGLCLSGSIANAATLLYSEDFENLSNTTLTSFGWSEFRGGSPSTPSLNSSGASASLAAGQRVLFMNVDATNSTTSWFAGLRRTYASALPLGVPLSEISLTVNVYGGGSTGPIGDITLRLESTSNNWIGWTIPGATLAGSPGLLVGGLLSETTHSAGTFNPNAASFNMVLAYSNTIASWGNDSSNIIAIDNVNLSSIPEPSTALLGILGALVLGFRRCR